MSRFGYLAGLCLAGGLVLSPTARADLLGDFKATQDDQKRAIRMAAKLGWDLAPQKARLEKYESNTAWTGDLLSL